MTSIHIKKYIISLLKIIPFRSAIKKYLQNRSLKKLICMKCRIKKRKLPLNFVKIYYIMNVF